MSYKYYRSCVDWPRQDVETIGGLNSMIDRAIDIQRRTFLKHVDRDSLKEIEEALGYAEFPQHGMTMSADRGVTYHRSKLHRKLVYFFKHSAIEHVFTREVK